jgi:hypothetical protein
MTTPRVNRATIGWSFWFWWMAASLTGGVVSVLLWLAIGAGLEAVGVNTDKPGNVLTALISPVLGAAFGTAFGTAQWLVLRRHVNRAGRWAPATIVGFIIIFVLASSLIPSGNAAKLGLTQQVLLGGGLGALIGTPGSVLQWLLVLRRQVNQAGWWVLASVVAWAIGFAVSFGLQATLGGPFFMAGFIVAVAITGFAMVWLLRHSASATSSVG